MKKFAILFAFVCCFTAAFGQISKADAVAFLSRNKWEDIANVQIYNWPNYDSNSNRAFYAKADYQRPDIASFSALDSGFSIVVTQNGVKREKFVPYASIRLIYISGQNEMVISLAQ